MPSISGDGGDGVPDLVSENTWSEVDEIYVQDKYQMGLKDFFDESNPWAAQSLTGRLPETSRKDRWHPTEEVKQEPGGAVRAVGAGLQA